MAVFVRALWSDDQGQDIAEYAVMLAVILVLVVGTVRKDTLARRTGTGHRRIRGHVGRHSGDCRRDHPPYRFQRQQCFFQRS